MKSILTIGEILVEIMATDTGDGFLEPVKLVGPFPSGAPAKRPQAAPSCVIGPRDRAPSCTTSSIAATAVLDRSDHLRVMGTALFSPSIVEVVLRPAEAIKARRVRFHSTPIFAQRF